MQYSKLVSLSFCENALDQNITSVNVHSEILSFYIVLIESNVFGLHKNKLMITKQDVIK